MSFLQLLLKPKGRNLIDVLSRLPNMGVGSRVTRSSWEPYGDSYWEVTAVKPRGVDGTAGKAWGVRVWRGVREEGRDGGGGGAAATGAAAAAAGGSKAAAAAARRIPGRAKRVWRWQPTDEELARLAPLLQEARRREAAAAAAASATENGAAKE